MVEYGSWYCNGICMRNNGIEISFTRAVYHGGEEGMEFQKHRALYPKSHRRNPKDTASLLHGLANWIEEREVFDERDGNK